MFGRPRHRIRKAKERRHGGSYTASAVHLSGAVATYIARFSPLTGVSDARTGLLSIWRKASIAPASFWVGQNNGAIQFRDDFIELTNNGNTSTYVANYASLTDDVWHHYIASWNTDLAAGNRLVQIYVDDAAHAQSGVFDDGPAFDCWYTDSGGWQLGEGNQGLDVSDLLFYPGGSFIDLSNAANRRKFIDASGKPVNPAQAVAAFGAPAVLFSGNAATYSTNQGTGGAFTPTGSITDASTSPSD